MRLLRSLFVLVGLLSIAAPIASAHSEHPVGDGRIPGRPDFQRLGDVEIQFHPKAGAYTFKSASDPPVIWFHTDTAASLTGGHIDLPEAEEPVICATSGHRMKVMYSTAANPYTPSPAVAADIRSYVRRMNTKIISESLRSSNNSKALRLRVDCDANGQINIYSFPHPTGESGSLFYWAYQFFGSPGGADSIKGLIFYDGPDPNGKTAGVGEYSDSSTKSSFEGPPFGNPSRYQTKYAVVYSSYWDTHTTLHELFHTMGAVQDDAPYSTFNSHCWTGLDVMCYDDDKEGEDRVSYSEAYCPINGYFEKPWGVPLDCNYDTYFDSQEESGEWLNTHWNVGGAENPFLIEQPPPAAPAVATRLVTYTQSYSATLSGVVTPNGLPTQYYFEYGLSSAYGNKVPVPSGEVSSGLWGSQQISQGVGLQSATTYHFRLVAVNGKGTSVSTDQTFTTPDWDLLITPNFTGASSSYLYDISCEPTGMSTCTAVGKGTSAGVDSPAALRWENGFWSAQAPVKKSGATHTRLLGVDCPSAVRCIAVGNSQGSEGTATLGEIWNEGKWSVQSTPVPANATSSELVAVGCNSTANCVGVGSATIEGVKTAIVERWTSPVWVSEAIPVPAGATATQLDGVDCLWSNFCVAVGRYTSSGGAVEKLVLFWNGTSWSLHSFANPEQAIQSTLLDVSCTPSPNACTAVGGWKNSSSNQFTLAYRFTGGSTWTLQSPLSPAGATASVFQDVSCATATSCTAVGSWVPGGGGGSNRTLASEWSGGGWSLQSTPDPVESTFSGLFGTSCRGAGCLAVGWSTGASGSSRTLSEVR